MEVAPRQTQVERPGEPAAPPLHEVEQLSVEPLDLRAVLDRLDARHAGEARVGKVAAAHEVLDARHALLRARDQDRAERRREDAVDERAAAEVRQPRLEALAHGRLDGRGRLAPDPDGAVDRAIAGELPAARRAGARVRLHAGRGHGVRLAGRRGDERRFDLEAGRGLSSHRSSLPSGSP